jgi:serine/threonine protein kinase
MSADVFLTGPLYVIVEYAPYGNLRDFLRDNRPPYDSSSRGYEEPLAMRGCEQIRQMSLTYNDLLSYAYQVARGLDYLSTRMVSFQDDFGVISNAVGRGVFGWLAEKRCLQLHVISMRISRVDFC